jgi:hypothetical protein
MQPCILQERHTSASEIWSGKRILVKYSQECDSVKFKYMSINDAITFREASFLDDLVTFSFRNDRFESTPYNMIHNLLTYCKQKEKEETLPARFTTGSACSSHKSIHIVEI